MDHQNQITQLGYEKINAPDLKNKERFAESLDRSLTNDLDENDDLQSEQDIRN
ncbi:MAG TPA: hypothetical protein VEC37_02475 [Bacillota bacterium]|nr:hypothetical protein [Bacillota bacterium]